jgi:hypothetical protein
MRRLAGLLALVACNGPEGRPAATLDGGMPADAAMVAPPVGVPVNTITPSHQYFPAIATGAPGRLWVTWYDYSGSPPGQYDSEVRLRAFATDGTPLSPAETTANGQTLLAQRYPQVAAWGDRPLVVWESRQPVEGLPVVVEFGRLGPEGQPGNLVDLPVSAPTVHELRPAVAVDPATGRFAVAWTEQGVHLRRYDASGTPVDPAPVVVSMPWQDLPGEPDSVAMWPSVVWDAHEQVFLVVWNVNDHSVPLHGTASIFGRRYPAVGDAVDPAAVMLDQGTTGNTMPDVAVLPGGGFVLVWESHGVGRDGSGSAIRARRFAALDLPLDPVPLLVNTQLAGDQGTPQVAVGCRDTWMVVWTDSARRTPDHYLVDARARRFARDGAPVDPADWPITDGQAPSSLPVVAPTRSGFAIAYEIFRADYDVELRLVDAPDCTP